MLLVISGVKHLSAQDPISAESIDEQLRFSIHPYTKFYTDNVKLSRELVFKKHDSLWKGSMNNELENLGFTKKYYCFKFKVKNDDTISKSYVFVIGNPMIKSMELFIKANNRVVSLDRSGNIVPFKDRPYVSNYFAYPLTIGPKSEITCFLFVDNLGQDLFLSLWLFSDSNAKNEQYRIYFSIGILVGIILLTLFLNLILFIFIRDKLYLLYSLYALSAILLLMASVNLDSQFLFPKQSSWNLINKVTCACIALFLLLTVMRRFLNQKPDNSRYHHLVTALMGLYLSTIVINAVAVRSNSLLFQEVNIYLFVFAIVSGFPVAVLSCVEKLRQGFKPALFYLIAISTPLIGGTLMAINMGNLFDARYFPAPMSLYWPPNPLQIGLCLEAVIICTGILYRYNLEKKEKSKLALAFSLALEKERTALTEQVLHAQEEERKRIAADLHDELGGNLAALKMTLQSYKMPVEKETPLLQLIDRASTKARNISHNLMPPEFEDASLRDLLNRHCHQLTKEGMVAFHFHWYGTAHSFDKHQELMIYRIVLELTNNIVKHAQATEAVIQLINDESRLEVMVEDNGKGFSTNAFDGIGLRNIRSRVEYLNGKIAIDSSPKGTTVIIQVPY